MLGILKRLFAVIMYVPLIMIYGILCLLIGPLFLVAYFVITGKKYVEPYQNLIDGIDRLDPCYLANRLIRWSKK